jgi:hypothetical protein
MADPTIQTFCCHNRNHSDSAVKLMAEFNKDSFIIVCMVSSIIGVIGSIYQVLSLDIIYVSIGVLFVSTNFSNIKTLLNISYFFRQCYFIILYAVGVILALLVIIFIDCLRWDMRGGGCPTIKRKFDFLVLNWWKKNQPDWIWDFRSPRSPQRFHRLFSSLYENLNFWSELRVLRLTWAIRKYVRAKCFLCTKTLCLS